MTATSIVRIGLGYDSHRLGRGGPLRIGGVDVPGDVHAIGHSDADVLLHAVTDSLLGPIGAPDIGRLFPDEAAENRDRDSREFVAEAARRLRDGRYEIINLDAVILAETPKMSPHIDAMRTRIAGMLSIDVDRIGLKAKTGEGVGSIGSGVSIASRVVSLVYRHA